MNLPVSVISRAALYLRVSTARQAEVDLSIPDQRLQTQVVWYPMKSAMRTSPRPAS
jgi:hypothetical protein